MIELRGVQLQRPGTAGELALFDGVDLDLAAGEVACVTGGSGSGKSMLLRLLYGAVMADAGRVRIFGHDVRRLRRSSIALLRRRVGIVPQDLQLFGDRTAAANVALALEVRGERPRVARRAAAELLAEVGLGACTHTRVDQLSRGQAQRVAIARAIAGSPALLLFDDPTSHQDDAGRKLVAELIERHGGLVTTNDSALLEIATVRGWQRLELAKGLLSPIDGFELPESMVISSADVTATVDPIDPENAETNDEIDIEITEADDTDEAENHDDHDDDHDDHDDHDDDRHDNVVVPFPRRSAGGLP